MCILLNIFNLDIYFDLWIPYLFSFSIKLKKDDNISQMRFYLECLPFRFETCLLSQNHYLCVFVEMKINILTNKNFTQKLNGCLLQ